MRYLETAIAQDAMSEGKLAFVSGPRQVGKTTMAKSILAHHPYGGRYDSWDDEEVQLLWLKRPKQLIEGLPKKSLWVIDEIHKHRGWKNKLKGLYDLHPDIRFLVTGSARLDFYRKSGDSLQGRYYPYRLHPFTLAEAAIVKPPPKGEWSGSSNNLYKLTDLETLGGFPEPFFSGSESKAIRWRRLHRERMIREDLRDLQNVRDIQLMENMASLVKERTGSPLSFESLRQDLHASFDSVRRWLSLLEAVYYCYAIRPYSTGVKNAIRKEPKVYLYDWSALSPSGERFENLIASHLLKSCHAWSDLALGEFELHYVRDKQKREVDFLVTNHGKPYLLLEVKSGKNEPTPALQYFQKTLNPTFTIQLVRDAKKERRNSMLHAKIQIMHVERFLAALC